MNGKEFLEEVDAWWTDVWDKSSEGFKYIGTIIRWLLITVIPIWLGIQIPINIDKYKALGLTYSLNDILSSKSIILFIPVIVLILLSGIGQIWRISGTRREFQERLIYYALKWLYKDLGFEENADADIRCTLWTPLNSKIAAEKMRLIQIVNYFPQFERTRRENVRG